MTCFIFSILMKQKPWNFSEDWVERILDYLSQTMNQMNPELMLMMQQFENEVKVHVDVPIHFRMLGYVLMVLVKHLSME